MKGLITAGILTFLLISIPLAVQRRRYLRIDPTVYVSNTGRAYHRRHCQLLGLNIQAVKLSQALRFGYRACRVCHPSRPNRFGGPPANFGT